MSSRNWSFKTQDASATIDGNTGSVSFTGNVLLSNITCDSIKVNNKTVIDRHGNVDVGNLTGVLDVASLPLIPCAKLSGGTLSTQLFGNASIPSSAIIGGGDFSASALSNFSTMTASNASIMNLWASNVWSSNLWTSNLTADRVTLSNSAAKGVVSLSNNGVLTFNGKDISTLSTQIIVDNNTLTLSNLVVNAILSASNARINTLWTSNLTVGNVVTFSNNATQGPPTKGFNGGLGDCVVYKQAITATDYPFSVGLETNEMWTNVPTGAKHAFYANGVKQVIIDASGLSACNVSASNVSASNVLASRIFVNSKPLSFSNVEGYVPTSAFQTGTIPLAAVSNLQSAVGGYFVDYLTNNNEIVSGIVQSNIFQGIVTSTLTLSNSVAKGILSLSNNKSLTFNGKDISTLSTQLNVDNNTLTLSNLVIHTILSASNARINTLWTSNLTVGNVVTFSNNATQGPPTKGFNGGLGDCVVYKQAAMVADYPYSVGIDTSKQEMWTNVPTHSAHSFYVNGSNIVAITGNGIELKGRGFFEEDLFITKYLTFSAFKQGLPTIGPYGGLGDCVVYRRANTTNDYPYSVGINANGNEMWTNVPTGAQHSFYVDGVKQVLIDAKGLSTSNVTASNMFTQKIYVNSSPLSFSDIAGLIPTNAFSNQSIPTNAIKNNHFLIKNDIVYTYSNVAIGASNMDTSKYKLFVDGTICANADVVAMSDSNLKTNVKRISSALEKVRKIGGYTFDRIDLENKRYAGVMAQEIQSVLPEAVYDEGTSMSVSYHSIIGLLIEAVKELDSIVHRK